MAPRLPYLAGVEHDQAAGHRIHGHPTVLMPALITRLAREQRGFTLIELLVVMLIGIVVLGAAMTLLEAGARSSTRTTDRVDVTQRGRTTMAQLTRRLRSQVCVDSQTPPIVSGASNDVIYWSDTDGDPYFTPQKHRIFYDSTSKGGRAAITEYVYNPDQTASQGPPWTYSQAPKVRVLIEDLTAQPGKPFLRYYAFDDTSTPFDESSTPMSSPLSQTITGDVLPANSLAKVVRIDVAYRVRPSRSNNADSGPPVGNQTDTDRAGDFDSSIWVRNSDYTDQGLGDRTWGARCG